MNKLLKFTSTCAVLLFLTNCTNQSKHGIYINEFSASNSNGLVDTFSFKHVDWIELYNGYDTAISLNGYHLSEDINDTTKWTFPEGTLIKPNDYLIIYTDNKDTLLHSNFKLSRSGGTIVLFSKSNQIESSINYPEQKSNVSYGREYDGSDNWLFYDLPSPHSTNNEQLGITSLTTSNQLIYSLDPGFYNSDQTLTLSQDDGAEIRYTLNGDIPTRNSMHYDKPIKITQTTVVRAISIEKNKLVSSPLTKTYFMNVDKNMPVISVVSDSTSLFDTHTGVYSNSMRGIPRYGNLEFLEDEKEVINQEIDLKISGNIAREFEQKAMVIEANKRYGSEKINYQFFSNKRVYSYSRILLRGGGHPDKYETMFRDGLGQRLTDDHFIMEHSGYRPAILYLNGKYWGIYNIREKVNEDFLVDNLDLDHKKYSMLQDAWAKERNGKKKEYQKAKYYLKTCEKTSANYQKVKNLFDIDNFINYTISEVYASNIDWPNWNLKFWKEDKENAKWRWILIDLDFGYGSGTKVDFDMIEFITSKVKTKNTNPPQATSIFRNLFAFKEFKEEFLQRLAISLNEVYSEKRVVKFTNKFKKMREAEIPNHIERWKEFSYASPWKNTFKVPQTKENWYKKVRQIKKFAKTRPEHVRNHAIKKFSLEGMVKIKTKTSNGKIAINTIPILQDTLTGLYFKKIPIKLEAIPNMDSKFLYWIINNIKVYSKRHTFTANQNGKIEAVFEKNNRTQLPTIITKNTTLKLSDSPYIANKDVTVNKDAILTIEPGVKILFSEHKSIIIKGGLVCNGTKENPIELMPNTRIKVTEWGAILLDNTSSRVVLNHVNLISGSWYGNRLKSKATITSINSDVTLDFVNIKSSFFPFYSENGNIHIKNSEIFSSKTCDFINIKYAKSAIVENCTIHGNDYPDTDAIDFDQINNGIIRNNFISGFTGYNSDAIDIGEASSEILIEGNKIFNMTDKGISIGQGSSATIKNNFIYGCAMGIGIKDEGSLAIIDKNTFYGNKYGVATFEKNENAGGGTAHIQNCIFSENRKFAILSDSLSTVTIKNSICDAEILIGEQNIHGEVQFEDTETFNFNLKSTSPIAQLKSQIGASVELPNNATPDITFTEINYSKAGQNGFVDWIEIKNNTNKGINLTGWSITNDNHNKYIFPQNFILKSNTQIIITSHEAKYVWWNGISNDYRLGLPKKMATKGNSLRLYNESMNLVDQVHVKQLEIWPSYFRKKGIKLKKEKNTWKLESFSRQ